MTFSELQSLFRKTDHIFKIVSDIDLEGKTLVIGENSFLDFQGGSFSNGTINGPNVRLIGAIKLNNVLVPKSLDYGNGESLPENPFVGQQYFNTSTHKTITWDGKKWWNPDGTEATS